MMTYGKILGIRSLEKNQTPGAQYAPSLVQQYDDAFEWKMLD
jgi:hypothetical protein